MTVKQLPMKLRTKLLDRDLVGGNDFDPDDDQDGDVGC